MSEQENDPRDTKRLGATRHERRSVARRQAKAAKRTEKLAGAVRQAVERITFE